MALQDRLEREDRKDLASLRKEADQQLQWGLWAFFRQYPWFVISRVVICLVILAAIIAMEWWIIGLVSTMTLSLQVLNSKAFYDAALKIFANYLAILGLTYVFDKVLIKVRRYWRIFMVKVVIMSRKWLELLSQPEQRPIEHDAPAQSAIGAFFASIANGIKAWFGFVPTPEYESKAEYGLNVQKDLLEFPKIMTTLFKSLKSVAQLVINGIAMYRFAFAYQIGALVIPHGLLVVTLLYSFVVNMITYWLGGLTQGEQSKSDKAEAKLRGGIEQDIAQVSAIRRTYGAIAGYIKRTYARLVRAVRAGISGFDQSRWSYGFALATNGLITIVPWLIVAPALFSGQVHLASSFIFLRLFYKIFYNMYSFIRDFIRTPLPRTWRRLIDFFSKINDPNLTKPVLVKCQQDGGLPGVDMTYHVQAGDKLLSRSAVLRFSGEVLMRGNNGRGKSSFFAYLAGEAPEHKDTDKIVWINVQGVYPLGQTVVQTTQPAFASIFPLGSSVNPVDADIQADLKEVFYEFDPNWEREMGFAPNGWGEMRAVRQEDIDWVEEQWEALGLPDKKKEMAFSDLSVGEQRKVFNLRYLMALRLTTMHFDKGQNLYVITPCDEIYSGCDKDSRPVLRHLFKETVGEFFGNKVVPIWVPDHASAAMLGGDRAGCRDIQIDELNKNRYTDGGQPFGPYTIT